MRVVRLAEVASIERRGVDPQSLPSETRYLGLEHIERGGRIIGHETLAAADVTSTKFAFTPEHLLYGKLRPYLAKISRPTFSGVCSTDILPVRPGPNIDRSFLAHYLSQPSMVAFATSRAAGASLPRLSPSALAEFPVPLPPVDEQRRIAAILDQADAIRTRRRQVLAHLDTLTQSIFHDMFGDPAADAGEIRFGDVARLAGGRNLVAADSTAPSPYRVLKISAVTTGTFLPGETKPLPADYIPPAGHLVRAGDLLMSRANTTDLVGSVAYVADTPANLALPDKVWRFEWSEPASNPIYYHALLSSPTVRHRISRLASGTGGSMKNISKAKLESMLLPRVHPARQQEFAAKALSITAHRTTLERAVAADDELFASLQSRAFRGEL